MIRIRTLRSAKKGDICKLVKGLKQYKEKSKYIYVRT